MKFHKNTVDAVLHTLTDIFERNKYADKAIEQVLKSNPKWGSRDRKFIAETTYNIVRWYRLLACALPQHENKNWHKIFEVYCVMKGLSENHFIQKKLENLKQKRKFRESIPDWLEETGILELGEERWEKEIHALNEEAKVVIRVNSLKASTSILHKKLLQEGIETKIIGKNTLLLTKRQNVFSSNSFKEGLFEVQDYSSQQVSPFLEAQEGMRVIDACAGTGGKTLHLAAIMKNKGKIIALDTDRHKLNELRRRAKRAGASNIETRVVDSAKVIKRLEESAERLLLDVPCSGLGVLRRNPDAKWKLSPEFIEKVKHLQQKIIREYSRMVKVGGIIVYSTCSILPSENEKQVKKFISENKNFELLDQKTLWPSEGFDGFYMAKLIRTG
jgi:16S rRNA (cytosine967-C5)-methyltransferase